MISRRTGAAVLILLTALNALAAALVPGMAQPLSYHPFADTRAWLAIFNFQDLASNLLFAIFGAWGLWFLRQPISAKAFLDPRERWPYISFFSGTLLPAFGSGYYHLMPDNLRLVWDRLPMTAERIGVTLGTQLLLPLLHLGIISALQWQFSEHSGVGDLRFYAAVQVYTIAVLLLLLLLPPRYTRTSDLVWVGMFYLRAKVVQAFDHSILSFDHQLVSGRVLKHLAAGMSGYFLLHLLQKRVPIAPLVRISNAA
jgi:hypothetical protein